MSRFAPFANASLLLALAAPAFAAPGDITVYKNRGCICCEKWSATLGAEKLTPHPVAMNDVTPLKDHYRVPLALRSCHTALIHGYVFEGHVPPELIRRVLHDKPAIAGLAVPGMPAGAPGMDIPGVSARPWQVIAFDRNGKTTVFAQR